MGKKIQFVHRARRFELTKEDFERAAKGVIPARVQKYSVTIRGVRYPTRQVVALGTGCPSIEFTSAAAYRIVARGTGSLKLDATSTFEGFSLHPDGKRYIVRPGRS